MNQLVYGEHVNVLTRPSEVLFFPDFFTQEKSDQYLDYLTKEVAWKQEPIKMFGKTVMQPRLTSFYGDEGIHYTYSGLTMRGNPWDGVMEEIRQQVQEKCHAPFNACLLNYYRDEKDSMGWHRDNEKALGHHPVIASVSFGAQRIFQFRNYKDKIPVISVELEHGSLLLMRGETQRIWEHRLPKIVVPSGPRINLTFRYVHL
jgi:alkylated DNA repair dioxygenase AlkB